jgi:tRNA threonylcarbamoyladenosine biosynthesis protein TsaB
MLHIDTGGNTCSVALSDGDQLLAIKESDQERTHAAQLTLLIDALMKESSLGFTDLTAVAVSMGPGSYTGLRIGVSTAKGICFATGLPLIAVSSLQSMCYGALQQEFPGKNQFLSAPEALLCPMIDARRLEVYTALFDLSCNQVEATQAVVIDETSFSRYLDSKHVLFFGSGSDKVMGIIKNKNAFFMPKFATSASSMINLAWEQFQLKKFADIAYFEPYYLKEFIATIPKKNIFRGV